MRSARSLDDRTALSQWSFHCSTPDISNSKAFSKGILWVKHVLRETSNPRGACECWYNRTIVANLSFTHKAPCEDCPENTFVWEWFVEPEFALRVKCGHAGASASAAWRAVESSSPRGGSAP